MSRDNLNGLSFSSGLNNCMMTPQALGPSITGTSARTITFWMKAGTNSGSVAPLTVAGSGANLATGDHFGLLSDVNDQESDFWFFGEDVASPASYDTAWHMYALTYSGTSGTLAALYRDGVLKVSQGTGWSTPPNTANGPLYLGCGPDGSVGVAGVLEHFFTGEIDDVRVFARVLCGQNGENGCANNAPNDIANLYAVTAP